MSSVRFVSVIGFSVIFTGTVLATVFYVAYKNSRDSSILGPASDWAWLGLIFGAIYGLLIGGISGAVIAGFQLSIPKAIVFGLILNLVVGAAFYIFTSEGWNEDLALDFIAHEF